MLYLFLFMVALILVLGMIPSFVSEDKLHDLVVRWYLSEKTNLDIIHDELHKKQSLIQKSVNDCKSISNCHSIYYFAEPVTIMFDIGSTYDGGATNKKFIHVDTLTLFALHGDIECRVESGTESKSVFIFEETHKLKISIESENCDGGNYR
ncbi:MAG: hypothetical protein BZ138_08175 [Methanosphaera sp. rholeuAM270]|nr:MAG: hypothetical protein BZ138_08175 [Methanosphaera sp. rholeuAM270]